MPSMTATNDPANPASASFDEPLEAQFGPHRFYAGEGGGREELRGAQFDVADLRGARFTDCDLTGVTIRDCWLVNVSISGYLSNVTVNGVDVSDFVSAELDRRHPERVQFREGQTADDVHAMWDTIERLWAQAIERAGRLPAAALTQQVNEDGHSHRHCAIWSSSPTHGPAGRCWTRKCPTTRSASRRAGIRQQTRPRLAST